MSGLTRLRNLCRRTAFDRELDEELQFHLEMRVERNLRGGMDRAAAEAEARRHLGSRLRAREGMQAAGTVTWLDALLRDIAYAGRTLRRQPWFTAVAVLTVGIGIGLNIAVFSVVDRVLVRDLPYHEPHRLALVRLCATECQTSFPGELAEALQALPSLDGVAFAGLSGTFPRSVDPESVRLTLTSASSGLLAVLGVAPILGRDFTSADETSGERVAIISYERWQSTFGGTASIVGTQIRSRPGPDSQPVTIVGVLPPAFIPPVWVARVPVWDGFFLASGTMGPVVRLAPAASLESARADIHRVSQFLEDQGSREMKDATAYLRVDPVHAGLFDAERRSFTLLLGATGILLLLACANLSTLLLARGRGRDRDLAIAASLGATRARLLRAALIESWLVCVLGTAVAVAVLVAVGSLLTSALPPLVARYTTSVTDPRVLAASAVMAMACAAIAGVVPALRATRLDLLAILQRAPASGRRGRTSARTMLVAGEAALGALLVVSAFLMVQTLSRMASEDVGYQPKGLFVINVDGRMQGTFTEVAALLAELPGITSVAVADSTGLGYRAPFTGFRTAEGVSGRRFVVSDSFFSTAGARLTAGRSFTPDEVQQQAQLAVVSDATVSAIWPGEAPADVLGRLIELENQSRFHVIGVVPDFKPTFGHYARTIPPTLFVPGTDYGFPAGEALVRTSDGHPPSLAAVQARVRERLAGVTSVAIVTVDAPYAFALADPRFRAMLFGTLALIGLLLAASGLYAVAAFDVRQREYEIGVRLAHGATAGDVRRLVIAQELPPIVAGLAVGLVAAFWATAFLQQFLYEVDPRHPAVFGAVAAIMILTALLAAWLPAWRASRLDPAVVLRAE